MLAPLGGGGERAPHPREAAGRVPPAFCGRAAPGSGWFLPVGQPRQVPQAPTPQPAPSSPQDGTQQGGAQGQTTGAPNCCRLPSSPSKQPISALQPPTSLQPACGTPGKKDSVLPQGSGVRGTPPCHAPHWPPPIPSQGGRLGPGALTSTPTNSPPHSSDTRLTPSPQARPPSNLVGEGAGNQACVFPM